MQSSRQLLNSEYAINQAINQNPDFYFYWCKLGNILKQKNQLDESLNAYYHALEINPCSSYCLYQVAEVLSQKHHFLDALEFYKKAITCNPKIYKFYEKKIRNLIDENNIAEAFLYFWGTLNHSFDEVSKIFDLANSYQLLLITGQMRSGTTLLSNLLNSQSSMMIYRDLLHVKRLIRLIDIQSLDEKLSDEQYWQLVNSFIKQTSSISGQQRLNFKIKSVFKPPMIANFLDFYLCVMGFLCHKNKKKCKIIGHKSTEAHSIISDMLRSVPNLKVIYIIRDPRDVFTSSIKFFGTRITIMDLIEKWRDAFNTVNQIVKDGNISKRLMILRYEDLLTRTEDTLTAIADFLQSERIEIPEKLQDYGNPWHGNSSFVENLQVLDSSRMGQWKYINPVASLAEDMLHDEMIRAGYEILKS